RNPWDENSPEKTLSKGRGFEKEALRRVRRRRTFPAWCSQDSPKEKTSSRDPWADNSPEKTSCKGRGFEMEARQSPVSERKNAAQCLSPKRDARRQPLVPLLKLPAQRCDSDDWGPFLKRTYTT
ncbi:unnamed protein product, partial [Polarella glacialis]